MKLNQKEAAILANGYDSEFWRIFSKHFLTERESEIAADTPFVPNWDANRIAQGRILELRQITSQMATVKKKQDKREKQGA